MNAELTPVHAILPLPPPLLSGPERSLAPERLPVPEVPVTTLFLKPVYGITVQRNALTVSVREHPAASPEPVARARG